MCTSLNHCVLCGYFLNTKGTKYFTKNTKRIFSELLMPRSLLFRSLVISKRSEESHKSLLPQSLRFLTSFRNDSFFGKFAQLLFTSIISYFFISVVESEHLIYHSLTTSREVKNIIKKSNKFYIN